MISNSSDVEHTWPTVSLPGPPRAIAYRDSLTVLRTEDIWHIFCFSCPFMSFEARRKSQYAKLVQTTVLQFFVANFRLWSRCRHFLIEWPSFVAISFGRCRYFLAHVACRNYPDRVSYNFKWHHILKIHQYCNLIHSNKFFFIYTVMSILLTTQIKPGLGITVYQKAENYYHEAPVVQSVITLSLDKSLFTGQLN